MAFLTYQFVPATLLANYSRYVFDRELQQIWISTKWQGKKVFYNFNKTASNKLLEGV